MEQIEPSTMNEQTVENPAILEKWLQKRRNRDDKEKEETNKQVEAEEHAVHEEMEEKNDTAETVTEKHKQSRVHSAFSLVRSQIRAQAGLDGQHMGILDVVNQITRELENNKKEQEEASPTVEITSSEEKAVARKDPIEEQMTEIGENSKKRGEELCAALLEEILLSLESFKKDLSEELSQLRGEMQSYTDQVVCGLETRLTNLLRIQSLASTTPSELPRKNTVESMETKNQRPPSMPPLGTSRRLNRTMTTITSKTSLPLSLGPRSSSEPLGGWGAKTATSKGAQMRRRDEATVHPPVLLPPALLSAQKGKKALQSRTHIGKPTC